VEIAPRRDPRAVAYTAVAACCLALGLLTGETELVAIAAGLVAVLALGLQHLQPVSVQPVATVQSRRVITGDPARIALTLQHPPGSRVEVVLVNTSDTLGEATYVLGDQTPQRTTWEIEIATPEWGIHELGAVTLRVVRPGAMCEWEQRSLDLGAMTVLPRPAQLSSLLSPRATQSSLGAHPARVTTGDGADFVDIRAYQPGDRLRDVNWKATAKRGSPQINRRRPERGGDVVIVLDATTDGWRQSDVGSELLQRAGQAAWSLARTHLAAQDRVGLLTQQVDGVDWLPPEGGLRAKYRVLETLLGANSAARPAIRRSHIRRHDIPPAALVIGISSLANNVTLQSLAAMRAHGRTVGVLALDPADILGQSEALEPSALRLATLTFEAHVSYVRRLGLPIVTWRPGHDLGRAVTRLAELTRRSHRAGLRA
jgi:uncharacterized protein (DUF58 family)